MRTAFLLSSITLACIACGQEQSIFQAYVDSDICSRLMLGPINTARTDCSRNTVKQGDSPVLVRLPNNMVLTVNKQKMIKPLVGELASVTGELKVNDGSVKLKEVAKLDAASIPPGDPARKLLDVRTYKAQGANAQLYEKIRHELAMMPYISEFDFISFTLSGPDVILTGWTVRPTNRSGAYNIVKDIPGVETVVNNIDVLPVGSVDMRIRAAARAALQVNLSRYFWGSGSDIKIIVKNGNLTLLGTVTRQADSDIANIKCNSLPGVFKVFNLLRVQEASGKNSNL